MGETPEERLHRALAPGGGPLALAESCTGGLAAYRVTKTAGASAYFDRGLVVYANRAKTELLGVDPALLEREGAVSRACAEAMLAGLFVLHGAKIGGAVTGIAGPEGGTPEKPVGTVWIAWGRPGTVRSEKLVLRGTRWEIQCAAAEALLERLAEFVEGPA
jgi:nicotinamide-nucleotide amidase